MDSIQSTVYYCCVSKSSRILYAYNACGHEIDNLVGLCLESAPPYHKWYFQTSAKKTYGFFMEDGYVYFAIVDEFIGNSGILQLLEHLRDEFKKVINKSSRRSMTNLNLLCLQEQLVPVVDHMIASLERVSGSGNDWLPEISSPSATLSSPCDIDGQIEAGSSTKAPLLCKSGKHEKKRFKDHVIGVRDIEFKDDSGIVASSRVEVLSPISLEKDLGSTKLRSSPQNHRKKWCCLVQIILAIDAVAYRVQKICARETHFQMDTRNQLTVVQNSIFTSRHELRKVYH